MANIYFLLISVLQVGTDLSPTSKLATVGPLSIIVIISAIKEALEVESEAKNASLFLRSRLYIKTPSVYQDRLGTNIEKS